MRFITLAAYLIMFGPSFFGFSQAAPSSGKVLATNNVATPERAVEIGAGKIVANLPILDATVAPIHCSSDGMIYLDGYADPSAQKISELYSVSSDAEAKHIPRALPPMYQRVLVRDFYASAHSLITLLDASDPIGSSDTVQKQFTTFISQSDRDGDSRTIAELNLPFEPRKVAILGSGKLLVLGIDSINRVPVLAVLEPDGRLIKFLNLENGDYDKSTELTRSFSNERSAQQRLTTKLLDREISSAAFVPYGEKVLLLQPGSNLPVRIFSDAGEERSIRLSLPPGFLLQYVVASEQSGSVLVRVQSASEFSDFAAKGMLENPTQRIIEYSVETGLPLREIKVKGVRPADVVCANNGKVAALYFFVPSGDSATTALQNPDTNKLMLASALR